MVGHSRKMSAQPLALKTWPSVATLLLECIERG
uniref:Uncharacterized protein n=1 Tax=Macrostomum lignano TaxID=282301 RepID=A0A1I8F945_9PLAT